MAAPVCSRCGLRPERTQRGRLPPWEVAKACAYDTVLKHISSVLGEPAHQLLGKNVAEFIAEQLTLVGGGTPSKRAVLHALAACKDGEYYPGKPRTNPGGRPREVTDHQEREIARAAMELKKRKLNPSPARVRAKLPRLAMNRATGKPTSDNRIRDAFKLRCCDETEDEPWKWLPNPVEGRIASQDGRELLPHCQVHLGQLQRQRVDHPHRDRPVFLVAASFPATPRGPAGGGHGQEQVALQEVADG